MRRPLAIAACVLIVAAPIAAFVSCDGESYPSMAVGGATIDVRVLDTRAERLDAMIKYGEADPFVPMLMAYPRERRIHLHTEQVNRGFDVVFLSPAGTVVDFQALPARTAAGITSAKPAALALLMAEGAWAASGAVVGATLTPPPMQSVEDLYPIEFQGKPARLWAEAVTDGPGRARGLMYRTALNDDEGMIFKYASASDHHFWMKNTRVPLSIAFFNEDGLIVTIRGPMLPGDEKTQHRPDAPVQYALEVNFGWFEKNGIKEGDVIVLPRAIKDMRVK